MYRVEARNLKSGGNRGTRETQEGLGGWVGGWRYDKATLYIYILSVTMLRDIYHIGRFEQATHVFVCITAKMKHEWGEWHEMRLT